MATYLGLYGGGTIGFGDLGGVKNGTVVAAATTINTLGSMALRGPSGVYRRSITSGADITINTNPASPFRTGFGDFLGVGASDATYRAMLLIHELGHLARRIYGVSGSQIEEDTDVPNAPKINRSNTKRVYDYCFK